MQSGAQFSPPIKLRALAPDLQSSIHPTHENLGTCVIKMQWNAESYVKATVEREDITAPDFDNEATLLSARPVVPLAKIGSMSRARWLSAWSAAFLLIALALGVLVQFGHAKLSPPTDAVSDSVNPLPTTEPFANDTVPAAPSKGSTTDTAPEVPSDHSESSAEQDKPSNPELKKKRGTVDTSAPVRRVIAQSRPDEPVDPAPSQSRREARRARREAERIRRRERVDTVDGIFKIEDIFGGSRTP